MNRRQLFRSAVALPVIASASAAGASPLIDCNVWLGEHPNRHLPWQDAKTIASNLQKRGVTQAWACTFDLMLHKDLASANARLAAACAESDGLLMPVGAVNPALPAWQSDVVRCAMGHGMKAIRVLPNYHRYELDDARFTELLALAAKHKLLVQIVTQLEDERTQHPLLQVPATDLTKLAKDARVMVLNANSAQILRGLRGKKAVIDTAFIEGVGGLGNTMKDWPADQIVFGSHTPWFCWEANGLKLVESNITGDQHQALTSRNALALLGATR